MKDISNLIKEHQWYKIYQDYKPKEIAKELSFKQAMSLAYQMLLNEQRDDNLRDYSIKLFEAIRVSYSNEWNADWKNDLLLGDAYYFTMNFNERFRAYKRASEKINPLPPALLVSLAGCYLSSEISSESIEEAEEMLKKALEQERSIEAVILMRSIYREKGDEKKFLYWNKVFEEVEKEGAYMKNKLPEVLKPEYKE